VTEVDAIFPFFRASEWFEVRGKRIATTTLDRETSDFAHLIGNEVIIAPTHDGSERTYKVVAVERFAHMPPWRAGENIGLMVEI
jgi:hypothetical protein